MPLFPGALNGFIPTAEAALQSNLSQNPNRFKLNQYVTVAKVEKPSFYANLHNTDEEARQVYADGRDLLWLDGTQSSVNFAKDNSFVQYNCVRYQKSFVIGDQAAETASWNVIADHSNGAAAALMTNRVQQVLTLANTTGNWTHSNTNNATSLGGGQWSAGTSSAPYAQIGIQAAIQVIEKNSNGSVTADDLTLVIGPNVALALSQTDEYRNYMKGSQFSLDFLNGSPNFAYGLGSHVYGIKVVVDSTVKVTSAKNATRAASYIMGNNALLLARPGALLGDLNGMSTLTLGMYEDLSIILDHDNFDRLTKGKVYDNYVPIVRDLSGYLITAAV